MSAADVNSPAAQRHQKLLTHAQKWVSQTFYGEMLKQMRKSPFKVASLDGGRGNEAFYQLLDQRLADHMSKGVGNKLVNSIVKKLEYRLDHPNQNQKLSQNGSGHVGTDVTA